MDRRKFLWGCGTTLTASTLGLNRALGRTAAATAGGADSAAQARVVKTPPEGANRFYMGNRAPLLASPFLKLPIGAIEPRGWLRQQLNLMVTGMTGQLADFSMYLHPTSGWITQGEKDPGWEEMPYWLRGYGDLGYVLKKDERDHSHGPRLDRSCAPQPAGRWLLRPSAQ